MSNVITETIHSVTSSLNLGYLLSIGCLKNENDLFRLLYQPSVHLIEAGLSSLKRLSSATDDSDNNMAPVFSASFVREQEKPEQSFRHLEMFVHCLEDTSSSGHSNCTLVYHQLVNSIEVTRLVLGHVEFTKVWY